MPGPNGRFAVRRSPPSRFTDERIPDDVDARVAMVAREHAGSNHPTGAMGPQVAEDFIDFGA